MHVRCTSEFQICSKINHTWKRTRHFIFRKVDRNALYKVNCQSRYCLRDLTSNLSEIPGCIFCLSVNQRSQKICNNTLMSRGVNYPAFPSTNFVQMPVQPRFYSKYHVNTATNFSSTEKAKHLELLTDSFKSKRTRSEDQNPANDYVLRCRQSYL